MDGAGDDCKSLSFTNQGETCVGWKVGKWIYYIYFLASSGRPKYSSHQFRRPILITEIQIMSKSRAYSRVSARAALLSAVFSISLAGVSLAQPVPQPAGAAGGTLEPQGGAGGAGGARGAGAARGGAGGGARAGAP